MAFSICKKSEPMNLTYITSLCDQSSSLVRRLTPKMIPIKTPANVAMVKALDFKVFKTTWPCFEGILNYKNETKSRQTAMSFKMFGEVWINKHQNSGIKLRKKGQKKKGKTQTILTLRSLSHLIEEQQKYFWQTWHAHALFKKPVPLDEFIETKNSYLLWYSSNFSDA